MKSTALIRVIVLLLLWSGSLCLAAQRDQPGSEIDGERLAYFQQGEAARGDGQDSLARLAYLRSVYDEVGREIRDSLSGLALHRVATMYLNAWEDSLALPYFRRSLAMRDSVFQGPHNERARVRTMMGMSIYWLDMQDSAAVLIQEANAMYEALDRPDSLSWLKSLNELGLQAIDREDYGLAHSSSYRAMELCNALHETDDLTKFLTYYRAARILMNFQEETEAHRAGLIALEALPDTEVVNRAHCLNLLALIDRYRGNYQRSYQQLKESVRIATSQPTAAAGALANAHLYLAEHHARIGEPVRSSYHERSALRYFTELGDKSDYHKRNQLSESDLENGNYAAAEERLHSALTYLCQEDAGTSSTSLMHLTRTLIVRARLYAATDRSERALTDLHEAFHLQDRLRKEYTDPASRRYLSEDLRPDMDLGVRLHYERFKSTGDELHLWNAFRLSERARAFSLSAGIDKRIGGKDIRQLRATIARLEREVARGDMTVEGNLEALRIRVDGMERATVSAPIYVEPLDSALLVAYLEERQAQLLEYHLADSLQLAFLLSPTGKLRAYRLDVDTLLPTDVIAWNEAIVKSAFRRKSLRRAAEQSLLDSRYWTLGWKLSQQLLPEAVRRSMTAEMPLYIVPDGALSYLPFAALPLSPPSPGKLDYRQLPYLQSEHAVSYAYSGAYLTGVAEQPDRNYGKNLLAFAPGFGADMPSAVKRAARGLAPLAPLRYNQEEARLIAAMLPDSEVYYDSLATRERFLERVGDSRILHLSTHGLVDPRHPELSFVAFDQPAGDVDEGQLLYFNDLYSLPINNELTVLSACETSLGQLARGEAPLSFASAFAAAGGRSTLTTLWQVDDRATKEMMITFYRELQRGNDRLGALLTAQNSLRANDYFHPYYWAAPTLYGMTGPIEFSTQAVASGLGLGWGWVTLATAIFAALLTFYYRLS
ncbi:CHAT domain-containing protein [Lewinella sp. IMCC34191]|uniref:CHAT domain-containing protein n=1 Tax=Lewinella sp. IMCC34191 TaxID=2259172 RepID=UPI000E249EED|nr:CHAT domain-containing protein [Lewinella sp. IMCC34191]